MTEGNGQETRDKRPVPTNPALSHHRPANRELDLSQMGKFGNFLTAALDRALKRG
jgi:hypothetical protein